MDSQETLNLLVEYYNNNIISNTEFDGENIEEASPIKKTVIRSGKVEDLTTCPPGYHLDQNGKCVKTSPSQAMALKKRALKSAKTRKSKQSQITRNRMKSMNIRAGKSPNTFKEKKVPNI